MAKSKKTSVDRRGFLKGAAAGAAALVAKPELADAQQAAGQNGQQTAQQLSPTRGANGSAPSPTQVALARETGGRPAESPRVIEHPGSDYMVDVLKTLNIEYLAANPGSTYESLHESLINYGDNKMPEFLTCCHEESAVAMAHGYAKIEGKPMMALIHGDIGLQHASMAIYNAYCRSGAHLYGCRQPLRWRAAQSRRAVLCIALRIWVRWFATTPSGTMSRSRSAISPRRRCVRTTSR